MIKRVSAMILAAVVATTMCITSFAAETIYSTFTYNSALCDGYGGNEVTTTQNSDTVDLYTSATARYNSSMTFSIVCVEWQKFNVTTGTSYGLKESEIAENSKAVTAFDVFPVSLKITTTGYHKVGASINNAVFDKQTESYAW